MHKAMNQYKPVWTSTLSLREKTQKMNAFVWNKGRWSLHLFPLSKTNRRLIDAAQARFSAASLKSQLHTSAVFPTKKFVASVKHYVFQLLSLERSYAGSDTSSENPDVTR